MARTDIVYLIHFDSPLHHARHYLGTTTNLHQRLAQHRSGQGSPLIKAVQAAGIDWTVARIWKGGRTLERELKRKKCAPKLCPMCRQPIIPGEDLPW